MRTPVLATSFATGAVLGVALLGASQTAQQTPPVFRGGIDVVQLDVSVLDKKRQPVRGLTAADFTVVENGAPQRIVTVSELALEGPTERWPVWARAITPDVASNDVGDRRVVAVVIEGSALSAVPVVEGVMDRVGSGDVVAVIGGGCYVPFTEDLDRLRACLKTMRAGPLLRPLGTGGGRGGGRGGGFQPAVPAEALKPVRPLVQRPHSLLRDVTEYLATVPQRRKAIIYVGLGHSPAPADPVADNYRDREPQIGGPPIPPRVQRTMDDYNETLWFARLANINIYTVYGTSRPTASITQAVSSVLETIAKDTGGFFVDQRSLDAGLDQLFLENGSYYLVGYQSTHPEMDGKYRKLSVKVDLPDVKVHARRLWYRPKAKRSDVPSAAAAAVPSHGLTGRLSAWMPSLDVAFDADVMPFAQPAKDDAVVAIVTALSEPVPFGLKRVTERMDVRVIAYGEGGAVKSDVTKRAQIDIEPSAENKVRYDVLQEIALAPGVYRLRLTAHNADTDKVGSIEFQTIVPDFHRDAISLSGVVIASASAEPATTIGTLGSIVPGSPTATRRFLPGDKVTATVRVYEATSGLPSDAAVTTRVLDAEGTVLTSLTERLPAARFAATRSADVTVELPLARLKAGTYLLSLQGIRDAHRTMPRDVKFVVR